MNASNRRAWPWVLALVLALVSIGAWWMQQSDAPAASALTDVAAESTSNESESDGVERSSAAPPLNATEQPTAPTQPAPASHPELAILRGRCVRAEDGAPFEGARIALRGVSRDHGMAAQAAREWVDPEPVRSDAEGRFEIAFDPPESHQFGLDIHAERRVAKKGVWGRVQREQILDLGVIELLAGLDLSGRVADETGRTIEGVSVSVCGLPLAIAGHLGAIDHCEVRSAADGAFAFGPRIPAGTWTLEARAPGWRRLSPERVEVVPMGAAAPLLVVMRRLHEISGVVVDDLGAPVEGVHVAAGKSNAPGSPMDITKAGGTFALYAGVDDPQPVRIDVVDPARCEPPEAPDPTMHPWGASGLRIVLQRARSVELLVVEKESGAPVLDYAVQCFRDRAASERFRRLRLGGRHAQGRLVVDGIWRGANRLVVHPEERALLPSEDLVFEVGAGAIEPLRVELERMPAFTVRAETADGRALVGAKVEVIALGSATLELEEPVMDRFETVVTYGHGAQDFEYHHLLSSARTDGEGRAEMHALPLPHRVAVRATHPDTLRLLLMPATFARDRELVLVLARGGSISGRVQASGLDTQRLRVSADRKGIPRSERGIHVTAPVAPDGTFALKALTAGLHDVGLSYQIPHRDESSAGLRTMRLEGVGAEIALGENEARELVLDASAHEPGQLRARALWNGSVPPAARIVLDRQVGADCGEFHLDAEGRFQVDELLPGTYRPILLMSSSTGGADLSFRGETAFAIGAREDAQRELHFVHRVLAVRVLDRGGVSPLAQHTIRWSTPETRGVAQTDAEGWFRIDPVPPETIDLVLVLRDGSSEKRESLGAVVLPAGETSSEATVVRP